MSTAGLGELNNMLKTLAMPLLQLGCDVDQVVRQIFEPLFCQLIHWYTSPTQARGAHSAIIIEALMVSIFLKKIILLLPIVSSMLAFFLL